MNYPEQQSWEWGTQIRASNRFRQMQSLVSQQSNLIQYHGEKSDFSVMILDQLDIYIQFSSVAQLGPTLCNPMNCSTPGLPVHHQLPESTQTHVHWVGDAIQPSHPLSSPSPPALNLSQHQGLFKWVSSSHQVAKVLEFQLKHMGGKKILTPSHTKHKNQLQMDYM